MPYAISSVDTRKWMGKAYPTLKVSLEGIVVECGKSEEYLDTVFESFQR